ncbi:PAS domain S-box-containing protein [Belliella pelovolcani]|uniref:histidine kinase n=3 Tax=Belliella pelovolcani TaxID=529505 RepID=A0A1N7PGM0_9BACT|nr:PAS domain S-box-containing protein [Belliella pelovolcani]
MKERGINSTFKKIIYESSEMVFLADDTFPYNIFYSNVLFDKLIGQNLKDKNLVGLGLDINSYIFKEELLISYQNKEYSFQLELPQENGSNYFLFYKGKEIRGIGLPPKIEAQQFFRNSIDLIAIGQENFLTWVSESIKPLLGYAPEEVINMDLCQYFHKDDLTIAQSHLLEVKKGIEASQFISRMLHKSGDYRSIDWQIQFKDGKFYVIGRDVTESEIEKKNTAKQNELFKLGEEVAKVGVWELNLEEDAVYWSDEVYAIHELEEIKDSFDLANALDFYLPAFQPVIKTAVDQCIKTGKEYDLTLKIKSFKGNEKWVRTHGRAKVEDGVVKRVFGTFQDVSEERQLVDELGLFKELFDLSPEAILISDTAGKIIFINQEANKRLGVFEDNSTDHSVFQFDQKFGSEDEWNKHLDSLKMDKTQRYRSVLNHQEGREYPVEVSCNLIEIQGEQYVISFSRDITERIQLEKSLQDSSDFLLHLTEQVPGALYQFVLDKEGEMKFSYLSPGIKTLLDLGEKDISSMNDIGLVISKIHPEDIAQVLMSSVASAKRLSSWNCQFRVKDSDTNDYKWVMGAAKPEHLENDDVVWYGYLADITEQKVFEETLKNARETAEKANKIKSEFLSMISHELRTPLNAISGSVYSLLQDEHTPSQESALNTINFAVDNLIIMINDLLDFQKIEAGKLNLEMNPMGLQDVIQQVINGLEFHASDSQNMLNLHFDDSAKLRVLGDKVRLAQIMNNLITNALKFTKKGKVDVTIKAKSIDGTKAKVYFEVKDTGIGIAKEHQERIFQDFDQIQHSFSKKYGGTGLGLSITKKLLDRMGSTIQVESEVGVGSTFYFEVEFEKLPEPTDNGVIQPISQALDLSTLKILMAEDNDVNSLVLGKIIKKWGFHFERVVNGQEAVEAVEKGNYDIVLMDIQMPVMNGFEATEKIKSFSKVPVIALTAAAKLEVMENIEKSGFDGFVAKPIDAAELLKRIKEVLAATNYKS